MASNLIADRSAARRGRTGAAVRFLEQQDDSLGRQLRAAEDSLRAYQQREHVIDVPQQATRRGDAARQAAGRPRRRARGARRLRGARGAAAARHRRRHAWRAVGVAPAHGVPDAARQPVRRRCCWAPWRRSRRERSQLLIRRTPAGLRRAGAHGAHPRDRVAAAGDRRVVPAEPHQPGGVARERERSASARSSTRSRRRSSRPRGASATPRCSTTSGCSCRRGSRRREVTGAGGDPTVRIVDARDAADVKPIRPRPMINLALSLVLGGLVGVTAALVRELRRPLGALARRCAVARAALPVLGAVPQVRVRRAPRRRAPARSWATST